MAEIPKIAELSYATNKWNRMCSLLRVIRSDKILFGRFLPWIIIAARNAISLKVVDQASNGQRSVILVTQRLNLVEEIGE
jgi:hypothetical protein